MFMVMALYKYFKTKPSTVLLYRISNDDHTAYICEVRTRLWACHGNFVPLKFLVRDQFFQKKFLFHSGTIFLKKMVQCWKFCSGLLFLYNILMQLYLSDVGDFPVRLQTCSSIGPLLLQITIPFEHFTHAQVWKSTKKYQM